MLIQMRYSWQKGYVRKVKSCFSPFFFSYVLSIKCSVIITCLYRYAITVDTEETLFLLATCYYRSGRIRQAYALLTQKARNSAQCRFLLAKCCYDLEK